MNIEGVRMRRNKVAGLLDPVSPERWVRRRRWAITMLIVSIVALAGYDHLRRAPMAPPVPSVLQDDIARFDGRTFHVTHTVDGDTVHIDAADKGKAYTIIRLWGVDTPEVHGVEKPAYFGPEASRFTHSLCDGKQVRLELVPGRTRDRYGRLLAYISLPDGTMLNERLIIEGCAYADTRFSHRLRAKFVRLEGKARQGKAGLWAGVRQVDMPAWRQKREPQPVPAEPEGDEAGAATGARLEGNRGGGGTFALGDA
jgi:micrococcal nuclease